MLAKPAFVLQKDRHENLFEIYARHPELSQVLVNINLDRDLGRIVAHPGCSQRMLAIYIDSLFLPALVDHEIVVRDEKTTCGYRAFYSDLQVELSGFTRDRLAVIAARHAEGIVESIQSNDTSENTIIAPLSFALPQEKAQALMFEHKRLLSEQLKTQDTHAPDSVLYRVSVVGKIYQ